MREIDNMVAMNNPNNGPFRFKEYASAKLCKRCKSVMVMITFKNDYVDDWKYECTKCYKTEY